jgi:hypothetical protein
MKEEEEAVEGGTKDLFNPTFFWAETGTLQECLWPCMRPRLFSFLRWRTMRLAERRRRVGGLSSVSDVRFRLSKHAMGAPPSQLPLHLVADCQVPELSPLACSSVQRGYCSKKAWNKLGPLRCLGRQLWHPY